MTDQLEALIEADKQEESTHSDDQIPGSESSASPNQQENGPSSSKGNSCSPGSAVTQLPTRQRTHRGRGLEIVAAGMLSLALLFGTGTGMLLATPLVMILLYYRLTAVPELSLSATRTFSQVAAIPGDTVTVSVTITNDSSVSIPDLRARDIVPDGLSVVDGSPMGSFALEPGESGSFSYEVRARRGRFPFETVEVICRNASGSEREQRTLDAQRTLVAEVSVESMPLAPRASQYTGRMQTKAGGSGVEFYSTREYHSGDSPRDIDWRRFAKTGEFTTIQYKDARAASIHLIVDSRQRTDDLDTNETIPTKEMCLYAGELIAETLMESRHQVGLTTIGQQIETHLPEKNPRQYQRIRRQLKARSKSVAEAGSDSSSGKTVDISTSLADAFLERTDSHTQFVCITGLDDAPIEQLLMRLAGFDRPLFVITPDIDTPESPGAQLTAVKREMRLDRLRRNGVTVLEWNTDEPLRLALKRRLGGVWA